MRCYWEQLELNDKHTNTDLIIASMYSLIFRSLRRFVQTFEQTAFVCSYALETFVTYEQFSF